MILRNTSVIGTVETVATIDMSLWQSIQARSGASFEGVHPRADHSEGSNSLEMRVPTIWKNSDRRDQFRPAMVTTAQSERTVSVG